MTTSEVVEDEPGFQPAKRPRDERFAQLMAEGGRPNVDCWMLSADPPDTVKTPGKHVSSTQALRRVRERVAYLKRKRAIEAAMTPTERLSRHRLTSLMDSVTQALTAAARAADKAGAGALAASLRKSITVHAGRSDRVERRSVTPAKDAGPKESIDQIAAKLPYCDCGGGNG